MSSVVWIIGIVGVAFAAWLTVFFKQFLPSPQRARLAIANVRKDQITTFRTAISLGVVLVRERWHRTRHGHGREGLSLALRVSNWFAPPVSYRHPVLADDWRPAMREGAIAVLERWNADLAVVGAVEDPGRALSLWFVPGEGDGTLSRWDQPYGLVNVRLQDDFHESISVRSSPLRH